LVFLGFWGFSPPGRQKKNFYGQVCVNFLKIFGFLKKCKKWGFLGFLRKLLLAKVFLPIFDYKW
jgi:hypothetical protein